MNQTLKALLAIAFIAVVISGALYLNSALDQPQLLNKTVMGVKVYSKIPLSTFSQKTDIGIYNYNASTQPAEKTCTFELSSTATLVERKGYNIQIQRQPQSIVIDRNGAFINGETDDEILAACHAFLCLRDNISCPNNLMDAKEIFLRNKDMLIVIDNSTGSTGIQGYAEILGELGYMQAKLADTNKDGVLDKNEIVNNTYHIYPYIMQGDNCVLQQFKNAIQTLNITNNTAPCITFTSGIFISSSRHNQIQIDGRKILISGDTDHLYTESIIVRDVLDPEWIRAYYNLP